MRVYPEKLAARLAAGLDPVYLVNGDEPLLAQEACDAIRTRAREAGCSERSVWHVESGFDWDAWRMAGQSQSLFSERQLIELRIPTGKPGVAGEKALLAYLADLNPDNVLLVETGRLDARLRNSKWVKALDKAGVWVQIWPLDGRKLPGWIAGRMRARGLQPDREAVALLAERVEGNPLACAQEIEKLYLLHGKGRLDAAAIEASVTDSARFDVFALADAALEGDAGRLDRVLRRLREEGVEPTLVRWALSREIRLLAELAASVDGGARVDQALAAARVWDKRKPMVKKALTRHPARRWQAILAIAGRVDRSAKGLGPGNPWDELLKLALAVAGVSLFPGGSRDVIQA